jgi:uncharacterized delta-60 repeat protein
VGGQRAHRGFIAGAALTVAAFTAQAWGAAGELDPSFSKNGRVRIAITGGDFGEAIATRRNKSIVVGGAEDDFGIARLSSRGHLDRGFSEDGRLVTRFSRSEEAGAYAVAIRPNGKVVVAGYVSNGKAHLAVVRYKRNGDLDPKFSGNGRVLIDLGRSIVFREDVDLGIQRNGRIVVAGVKGQRRKASRPPPLLVARLKRNGTLDRAFGDNGRAKVRFGEGEITTSALVPRPDGKIVLAGTDVVGDHASFSVARIGSRGKLDPTFAGDGRTVVDFGDAVSAATSLAIEPDGRIVAAGATGEGEAFDVALARLDADGSPDPTFSDDGRQTTAISETSFAAGVAIQADGKIVLGGSSGSDQRSRFAVVRYRPDGDLDSSFSGDGIQTTTFGPTGSLGGPIASGVAIQRDGKILVVGHVNPRRSRVEFAVARYQAH